MTDWRDVGYDRAYKADLVEELPEPPELIVLGGSRAQRFEPRHMEPVTGLSAFNFAVQNEQRAANERLEARRAPSSNRYNERGRLLYNSYDKRLEAGQTQERAMRICLDRMVPRAGATTQTSQQRSRAFFRKLLALYNERGVTPAIVIIPYHPDALSAYRAVGWERKQDRLKSYPASLQDEFDFGVLDYTEIESFGDRPSASAEAAEARSGAAASRVARPGAPHAGGPGRPRRTCRRGGTAAASGHRHREGHAP